MERSNETFEMMRNRLLKKWEKLIRSNVECMVSFEARKCTIFCPNLKLMYHYTQLLYITTFL
jgi:hypothetical protein